MTNQELRNMNPNKNGTITNRQYEALDLYMDWGMYEPGTADKRWDNWILDTKTVTPVPDGIYPIRLDMGKFHPSPVKLQGIEVKDGHFELEPTVRTIEKAIRTSYENLGLSTADEFGFDHRFIEDLVFEEDEECFTVVLGS